MTIDTSRGSNGSELEWGDYVSIAIYFIAVISVGLWVRILFICAKPFQLQFMSNKFNFIFDAGKITFNQTYN